MTEAISSKQDPKAQLIQFAWHMKKQGYSEPTIECYGVVLKQLTNRGADLVDVESVKETIASQHTWGNGRKLIAVKAYTAYLKMQGLVWSKPKYKPVRKLPFIPTEIEVDVLISECSPQMAAYLLMMKETGARCGEVLQLKWADVDSVNGTVRITPEKGSNPRVLKISAKLLSMLNTIRKTDRVYNYTSQYYARKTFIRQRKRIAKKYDNPRLLMIHFHTLRHWKATMEYARTKDILHVMQLLGHRDIKTTLKYTQLIGFSYDEYCCKTAKTVEEATKLIETGYEYVTDIEGYKLFRKRK